MKHVFHVFFFFPSLGTCTEARDESQGNFEDYPDGTSKSLREYVEICGKFGNIGGRTV